MREKVREAEGREPTPSAGSIDSQSVDSPAGGEVQGRDNHKKVDGRKGHILVDTLGLLLAVPVTAASADDGRSAPRSLDRAGPGESPRLGLIRADNKYHNHALYDWVRENRDYRIRVVSRPPGSEGWVWLPRRWVVEIVHSQVTKPDVLPLRAGREDVVDLDLVVGHDDAITSNSTSSRLRSKVAS